MKHSLFFRYSVSWKLHIVITMLSSGFLSCFFPNLPKNQEAIENELVHDERARITAMAKDDATLDKDIKAITDFFEKQNKKSESKKKLSNEELRTLIKIATLSNKAEDETIKLIINIVADVLSKLGKNSQKGEILALHHLTDKEWARATDIVKSIPHNGRVFLKKLYEALSKKKSTGKQFDLVVFIQEIAKTDIRGADVKRIMNKLDEGTTETIIRLVTPKEAGQEKGFISKQMERAFGNIVKGNIATWQRPFIWIGKYYMQLETRDMNAIMETLEAVDKAVKDKKSKKPNNE